MTNAKSTANGEGRTASAKVLVVVPCLNEEKHLAGLLSYLDEEIRPLNALIVVADGGSTDSSIEIIQQHAARNPQIVLLRNPRRIQSSGINLAVKMFGDGYDYLVRIDAHSGYPRGFVTGLVAAALEKNVCSVVVPMATIGTEPFQRAAAAAQNSRLGNGGSRHRLMNSSGYVDHGHHALISIRMFTAAGGYDETFSHNEDAELDVRLGKLGGKIWLDGRLTIEYYPRKTFSRLINQYYNYGTGRARNAIKHRTLPKIRQLVPMLVAPALVLALFSPLWWPLALPFLAWLTVCVGFGIREFAATGQLSSLHVTSALVAMHLGWSTGFIVETISYIARSRRQTPSSDGF